MNMHSKAKGNRMSPTGSHHEQEESLVNQSLDTALAAAAKKEMTNLCPASAVVRVFQGTESHLDRRISVSYTHLTLPTKA